ncbi:MAG: DEAD/DEAH box helicase [Paracoccaceae bacterium]
MTDLQIAAPLAAALAAKGYDSLTPVQKAVLAEGVAGRDALVSAQTGSGKTVAFGLAIAPEVLGGIDSLLPAEKPLALIVAPTRELALQVRREFEWLYGEAGAQLASCVGGMDYRTERRALDRGAHVVVGTPGRLRDHIERGSLDLSGLKAVVLDEADEMLDLGFAEDLEFILGAAPEGRRTLMFSATVPKEIEALAGTFQRDALRIVAQGESKQHVDIEYRAYSVAARDKEHAIFNVLRFYEAKTAIVFCKTRANVNHLLARMGNRGFQVVALSGELSQQERTHALQALRDGRARVCIATDVAARGIDLPGLELVVHADLPSNSETLLHRSGRTGRAGRKGTSALIVPPAEFRKAQRLLSGAKVVAEWGPPPSADDVQARDDQRIKEHPALHEAPGEDLAIASDLLDEFGAEQLAAAFVRLWREGRSAPEVLSDQAMSPAPAPREPRERGEFGPSVWFELSVGHTGRAEARWLLPKICDAGGIDRNAIGAIRVQQDRSFVQIAEGVAGRFPESSEIDRDLVMTRLAEAPNLDRPERPRFGAARPERSERRSFDAPRSEPFRSDAPREDRPRGDRPDRGPKPAYQPKPSRFVDEDEAPRPPRRDEGEERRPHRPREEGDRKPYARREEGDRKPYAPREERKPYAPREGAERKPYARREESDRKPFVKRDDAPEGERKPRWKADDRKPKSAGYKSHGGGEGKPARSAGYKSHSGEGRSFAPRGEGEARPARATGFKSHGDAGARPAAKFGKPAAKPAPKPKGDARDTSKRFVPPRKPKA